MVRTFLRLYAYNILLELKPFTYVRAYKWIPTHRHSNRFHVLFKEKNSILQDFFFYTERIIFSDLPPNNILKWSSLRWQVQHSFFFLELMLSPLLQLQGETMIISDTSLWWRQRNGCRTFPPTETFYERFMSDICMHTHIHTEIKHIGFS